MMATAQAAAQDFETATDAVRNMGIGWNLGNTLEANNQTVTSDITSDAFWGQQGLESENCWGQASTKPELLRMMKEAGFGAIRVPVTWYNHMDRDGRVSAEWMARVHEVVDYVVGQGLYCIINVHHDTGADSYDGQGRLTGYHWIKADADNYQANRERYEYLWQQIATEFRDYDHHLLFESYNEMLDRLSSWCFASFSSASKYDASLAASAYQGLNGYAQSFVSTVRATGGNNARRNLVVNTYGACCGSGTWSSHLKEPLSELTIPTDEAPNHLIVQVHDYPNIEGGMAGVKKEIDDMVAAWQTHFISKGIPMILGEWGTANVDKGDGKTDYDVRRDAMFEFVDYMVQKCKDNNVATFWWMGLSDGAYRSLPAFNQPDLAERLVKAYHGSSFQGVYPKSTDYTISFTVDFAQQWSELYLYHGSSFTSADYSKAVLQLDEAPADGTLQWKVYCSKYANGYTSDVTAAESSLSFLASLGTITAITLQCKQPSAKARVKSMKLVRRNGEEEPCNPTAFWGCTLSDITATTAIRQIVNRKSENSKSVNSKCYDLSGRRLTRQPAKGVYIRDGKKVLVTCDL